MKKTLLLVVAACLYTLCATPPLAADGKSDQAQRYSLQGEINAKIPVSVWLEIKDGLIAGELIYTKTGSNSPVRILGTSESDGTELRIYEIFPDGIVTGIIDGALKDGAFAGTWSGPGKMKESADGEYSFTEGKSYPIILRKSDAKPGSVVWNADPAHIPGTYRYSHGKNMRQGEVVIHSVDNAAAELEIHSVTNAPSFNMADIDKRQCTVAGNSIICEADETCAFSIRLAGNFLTIDYLEGRYCEGYFGRNAYVTGTYLKMAK